ncbi:uncharacterized protein LOC122370306 [Amphibalanus amphitrite]|uniref:uncharacterized protein LOC122370306 n=1 Tax=Amphibalanus amphitrite TaxID=1232801 RepID=UPI001C921801|nr:uncharacterized protein LOC122370306 [Amphibalanus amphitrite]
MPNELTSLSGTIPPWHLQKCDLIRLTNERKANLSDIEVQCQFNDLRERYATFSFCFTDGSKNHDGVGCAYVLGNRRERFKLPNNCSVFTAEAFAILRALLFVEESGIMRCVICTDSLSVLTALRGPVTSHPTIMKILETCHRLITLSDRELVILWIPGHCSITGNELADRQAREAISLDQIVVLEMGPKEHYPDIGLSVRRLFNQCWQQYNSNTNLKLIKDEVGSWSSCKRASRREEILLCRMRIGHTRFTHGHIIDRDPRPECNRCLCPQSVKHILVECPVYATHRQSIVQKCLQLDVPLTLKTLLGDQHPDITDEVFRFLRATNLFKKL